MTKVEKNKNLIFILQIVFVIFLFGVSFYRFNVIMYCTGLSRMGEGLRSMEEVFIIVLNALVIGLLLASYKFKNLFLKVVFFITVLSSLHRVVKFISGGLC